MRVPRLQLRARLALLPTALLLALWLPGAGQGAFRVDTGLYSAIGLHAWREGPLWPLMSGDAPYFNKPPLAIWAHGLLLSLFGPELWAARLPSLLIAIACTEMTRRIVGALHTRRTGLAAACILALTLEFFRYTKAVSLDLWLTLFLLMAAWCMVHSIRAPRASKGFPSSQPAPRASKGFGSSALLALSGVPLGLGLLVKPIVALLALPTFGVWLLMTGRARRGGVALIAAGAIACAVASTWYFPMYLRFGGAFIDQHFTKQAIERATGESFGADPWWYYLRLLAETYWPWLIGVLATIVAGARGRLREHDRRGALMAALWCVAWLAALSLFAGKSGRYAVPLYPMMAWLAAIAAVRLLPRPLIIVRRAAMRWLAPVMLVGALALASLGVRIHSPATPHWAELYEFVRAHPNEEIWAGGDMMPTCANVYLHTGRWPRTVLDQAPQGVLRLGRDEIAPASSVLGEEVWRSGPMFVVRVR